MSKTFKDTERTLRYRDGERPTGFRKYLPRFGNNRKMWAGLKVKQRRAEKRKQVDFEAEMS